MKETTEQKARRLRDELAKAEEQAKKENDDATLQEAIELLEGRAYVFNRRHHSAVGITIALYSKVGRNAFGKLTVDVKNLCVVKYSKPAGYEIYCNKPRYAQGFDSARVLLMDSVGEMPKAEFMKAWRGASHLGDCVFKWLSKVSGAALEYTEPYDEDERYINDIDDIDIPVLQFDPHDTHMLPNRFKLLGRRYILTPASIRAALAKLDAEEHRLAGGSHLYQECDMGYVTGKSEQIARLRAVLAACKPV